MWTRANYRKSINRIQRMTKILKIIPFRTSFFIRPYLIHDPRSSLCRDTLVKNLRFWIVSEIRFNRVGLWWPFKPAADESLMISHHLLELNNRLEKSTKIVFRDEFNCFSLQWFGCFIPLLLKITWFTIQCYVPSSTNQHARSQGWKNNELKS